MHDFANVLGQRSRLFASARFVLRGVPFEPLLDFEVAEPSGVLGDLTDSSLGRRDVVIRRDDDLGPSHAGGD